MIGHKPFYHYNYLIPLQGPIAQLSAQYVPIIGFYFLSFSISKLK